jgi:DNA polymerase-3 subunit gamma/tau
MGYLVLARKYRPQRFGEMTGQEHVVRTLSNALKTGQLAHAFLFTGPRGVGKTTCARLVAKCLDCEKGPTAEPCGTCVPCVEIAEGRCVDVVEIDAASNNGVDNVRDIVEAVKYRPARDRFKVFVVDEVHMLSAGAFNALLKTLEEPPPHVKFVLATTDVHRVPETIVSRCQRFDFRRLTQQQIVDQLRHVADAEGLRVSDAALALVARSAEGGMRDALSMLDQVRAACGDRADDAAVAETVGAVDPGAVARLAGATLRRDGAAVLVEIEALHSRGQEMKRVAEELVRHVRNLMVVKLVPQAPLDLAEADRREVLAQAESAPAPQLARLFDIVQRSVGEVKRSEQPRYTLEIALLKACFLAPGADVQELMARLDTLGPGGAGAPPGPSRPVGSTSSRGGPPPAPARGPAQGKSSFAETAAPAASDRSRSAEADSPGTARAAAAGADPWRGIVAELERVSPSLASSLKQAVVVTLDAQEVSLRIPPGIALTTVERRRAELEAVLLRTFGRAPRLLVAAGEAVAATAAAAAAAPRSIAQVEQAEREARSQGVRATAAAHPKIQEAVRILEGEVTKIEEL